MGGRGLGAASKILSACLLSACLRAPALAQESGQAQQQPQQPPQQPLPQAAAPSDLRLLELSSHSITASWSANGNPRRTLYRADIWSAKSSTKSLVLLSTTACFQNLAPSTFYRVRVQASIDDGLPSEAVSFSARTLPAGLAVSGAPGPGSASGPPVWMVSGEPRWVQVGAYRDAAYSQALAKALNSAGHKAVVTEAKAAGGVLHQVRVGPFPSWDAARDEVARIEADKAAGKLDRSPRK